MNILVTNDDGIYSPGLMALAEVAAHFGKVTVMAPDVEQSSMGHAITHSRPLSYRTSPVKSDLASFFRVNGTPADCVALGTHVNANTDLVLSGVNMGYNLGHSCWHSGTLAAAKQALLLGKPGIALSTTVTKDGPHWGHLKPFIKNVLEVLLEVREMALFNVNFPPRPGKIIWTRQDTRKYDGTIMPGMDRAAPERTETSNGFFGAPNFLRQARSSWASCHGSLAPSTSIGSCTCTISAGVNSFAAEAKTSVR